MRIAYVQSIGGASGDMLLGAFLDLGLPLETLKQELTKLGLSGYELAASQETRLEIRGTNLTVTVRDSTRHTPDSLLRILEESELPPGIKARAKQVLGALWQAESRIHGNSQQTLELDELGSIDTLVDVVGFAIGLAHFEVDQVYASPLVLGAAEPPRWPGGYPNPAPATLELVAMAGALVAADRPMYQGAGELTTPTGAAIITSLAAFERPPMSVDSIGVGLGTKDPENFANVTRIWLGEVAGRLTAETQKDIVLLETNLDDATGLVLGHTQDRLFSLGALDVWYSPVQMKKNRPGVVLSVLVPRELEASALELIFRETPTLGIRTREVERYVAERRTISMETDIGVIDVKVKYLAGVAVGAAPEFEDCRRIAVESATPFQEVYQQAAAEARRQFLS